MADDTKRTERVIRPLADFLRAESAGGVVLVVAVIVALVWANSPWKASYQELWATELGITLGNWSLQMDLQHWINDGLMTIFFLVVGLEIKRELVQGELRDPRRAALPAIAAVGGMVVPALLYLAVNAGGDGGRGWGVPMATDIAMAVGVLALLGSRIAPSLKLFLLALAIVDDIGAIVVIAIFYTEEIHIGPLLVAIGLIVVTALMRLAGVRAFPAYVVVGIAMWLALHETGLHATLVGVLLGLMAPTIPMRDITPDDERALAEIGTPTTAHESVVIARQSVSAVEWLEHLLHPWTSFVIVPLFALANAGIPLDSSEIEEAASSPITLGIVLGLVVGKPVGIAGFAWLGHRLRLGVLPEGTGWTGIVGVAALGGIGFTMSIFVASLAFEDVALVDEAKIGILVASIVAAGLGATILMRQGAPKSVDG